MSLSDHQAEFTKDIAELILWVPRYKLGWRLRLKEVHRPIEMQTLYVERGSSKTMNSNHLESRAADLILDINGQWQAASEPYTDIGIQWEMMSMFNRWGGRWGDGNHFERRTFLRNEPDLKYTEVTA